MTTWIPREAQLRAHAEPWNRMIQLALFTASEYYVLPEIELVRSKTTENSVVPLCSITSEMGQTLMDDLWSAGLRPTEGSGSAGSLAAVQEHLKDLKTLVFDPEYTIVKKQKRS